MTITKKKNCTEIVRDWTFAITSRIEIYIQFKALIKKIMNENVENEKEVLFAIFVTNYKLNRNVSMYEPIRGFIKKIMNGNDESEKERFLEVLSDEWMSILNGAFLRHAVLQI